MIRRVVRASLAASVLVTLALPARGDVRPVDIDEKVAAARAAVAKSPDDADLRLALARALAVKARRAQVQAGTGASTRSASGLRVEIPDASRVEIGYDAAPFEEALLHLSEGIRREPTRADLRMLQCMLLTDGARIDRAAAAIRDAARELPRSPSLPSDLARFGAERGKRGDLPGAARLLGEVAAAFPEDAAVQGDYGMALARTGRGPEALVAMERAVDAAPGDLAMLRMRATVAMALREFPAAEVAYLAAFKVSRDESDRFGAAAAAYAAEPVRGLSLLEEMATAGASAPPGLADLASRFLVAGRAGDPGQAEAGLARQLREQGQPLLAVPLLHRCLVRGTVREAREDLAAVYGELRMPGLAQRVLAGRRGDEPPVPQHQGDRAGE